MEQHIEIIRADILGYCMGVRRAVDTAEHALREYPGQRVYTLGPLIHNKAALDSLARKGIRVLKEPYFSGGERSEDIKGCPVIIRAHGVPPETRDILEKRGARVIDATCPRVLSSQKRAALFSSKGYTVIIAGDRNHGEVTGIAGYARECIVVENCRDAESLSRYPEKAVLLSQTTITKEEYDAVASVLRRRIGGLVVLDTICPATAERQEALKRLGSTVEGILVIGGHNSANTYRLYRSAAGLCANAALVENPEEIPAVFFTLSKIGLTAGASTPDFAVDAVEAALKNGAPVPID